MDFFTVLTWVAFVGFSLLEIAVPILFSKILSDSLDFIRKSERQKFEDLRDYTKKIKKTFYIMIAFFALHVIVLVIKYFNATPIEDFELIPLYPFIPECIFVGFCFKKYHAADRLFRYMFAPTPSRSAFNPKRASNTPTLKEGANAPAITNEEWNRMFGESGGKKEELNENLDIAKEADKELLNYLEAEKDGSEADAINENSDLRKLPDSKLMEYLKEGEKPTESIIPAENKQTEGESLNICPSCGYLNFEGNTQCDFCGAELK